MCLKASQCWKTPGEINEDINKCDFLILYNKMNQHLEKLHNSMNQYFQMTNTQYYKMEKKIQAKCKIHQISV